MKNKVLRRVLTSLLVVVFLGSSAVLLWQLYNRQRAVDSYNDAAQLALPEAPADPLPPENPIYDEPVGSDDSGAPEDAPEPEQSLVPLPDPGLPLVVKPEEPCPLPQEARSLQLLDLDVLRETNEDVIGWIFLPDTVISYPLLKSHDNAEYLNLTWDKQYSRSGSIFLERKSSPMLDDFHTLIYGHNWQDGIMFSPLLDYADQAFFEEHPYVYIATDDAILQYAVYAAYTADVVSNTYRLYFEDDARKQECIDFYLQKSQIDTGIVPTTADRLLTLSTCTGRGIDGIRWVVQTVLTAEFLR